MGEQSPVKYHYSYRFFTYSIVRRGSERDSSSIKSTALQTTIRFDDTVRLGVWLGRHICQTITQVS